jgi:ribosomal protein S18 acetylase RimI-like enzyme
LKENTMENKKSDSFTERMASMGDLPAIHGLELKTSLHYLGVPGMSLERITNEYESPGFDPAQSVCLIETKDGTLIALAEVWDESDPPVHPEIWMTVDPDYADQGLEENLLAWGEERAKQALDRVDPELKVALWAYISSEVDSNRQALLRAGFSLIRHGFRMRIDMKEEPPAPVWPAGIHLKPYDPESDARLVYEVDDEVFQDHFGFVQEDPEEGYQRFMHHLAGDDSYDPSLWFLAYEGEELVGFSICRRYGADDPEAGYISTLGVRRPWRRKGVALALLQHTFQEYYRRGKHKVDLGVDADSLTGATDLYKKAGMYVLRQYDLYEKVLRPGKDISVSALENGSN